MGLALGCVGFGELVGNLHTPTFKVVGLRVISLAKRVCCQLVGKDIPQVPLDPPQFMLALISMTDAEY